MKLGLVTPVVTRHPANDAAWTEAAGPAEISAIAETADRLGFHHLTCSEHVAVPASAVAARGSRYYDPLATLAFVAARTQRIRLVTHVLVLGYHHPLALAKRYGTLDLLSGGRLVLGVGVGTLREEFALLGAAFDDRGPRADDALRALRAALGRRTPAYAGPYYRFSDLVVDPCAAQPRVPLWVGGRTARSLRRALALADGWDPFGLELEALAALVARVRDAGRWRDGFDLVLPLDRRLDPVRADERARLVERLGSYRAAGATAVHLRFVHGSLAHYLEQLEAVAREVAPAVA